MNIHSFSSKVLVLVGTLMLSVSGHAQFVTGTTNGLNIEDPNNYLRNDLNFIFYGTANQVTKSIATATYEAGSTIIYTGAFNAKQLAVGDVITGAGIPANTVITAINNAGMVTISAPADTASSGALTVTQRGDYQVNSRPQADGINFAYTPGSNQITILKAGGGDVTSPVAAEHYVTVGVVLNVSGGAGFASNVTVLAVNGNVVTVDQVSNAAAAGSANYNVLGSGHPYWGSWTFNANNSAHTIDADRVVFKNGDLSSAMFTQDIKWKLAPASGTFAFIVDMGWTGDWLTFDIGNRGDSYYSVIDYQGNAALFNITPSVETPIGAGQTAGLDNATLNFTGSNISSLTKDGAGSLQINSTNPAHKLNVSGPVNINNGQVIVDSKNLTLNGPRIAGAKEYNLNGYGAVLQLNAGNSNANLIENDAKINLNSGIFNAYGSVAAASQQVGDVTLKGGHNIIGTAGASASFTLTMSKLVRDSDATVNFIFGNNATPIVISDAASATALQNQLIGGGGAAGGKNISILPWAGGRTSGAISGLAGNSVWSYAAFGGQSFVTVSGGTVRMLTNDEYYNPAGGSIGAAGVNDNVWLGSGNLGGTVTASTTINSLRLTNWDGVPRFSNGATLTLNSGALMFVDGGGRLAVGAAGDNGTLSSGSRALIVQGAYSNGPAVVYVPVTNTITDHTAAGLILAMGASSNLVMRVNNDYTGYTHVQSGSLTLANTDSLDGYAALLIDKAGVVTGSGNGSLGVISAATELRGDGKVNFNPPASLVSSPNQLNIGAAPALYAVGFTPENPNNNSVNVGAGGLVAPGPLSVSGPGALTFGENVLSVNFLDGSTLALDLAAGGFGDVLDFTSSASVLKFASGATIALNFLDGYAPVDGDTWLLATGFNTAGSSLPANLDDLTISGLPGDMEYELLFTTAGLQLSVTAIPEPSTLLLTVSGLTLLAYLRRRRSK